MNEPKGAHRSMRKHRIIALTALLALVVGACNTGTSSSAPSAAARRQRRAPRPRRRLRHRRQPRPARPPRVSPDPARGRIRPRPSSRTSRPARRSRSGRSTCRRPSTHYIKETIARFEATYPGVRSSGKTTRPPSRHDLNNAFAAGHRPGRHQPLGQRGLGQRLRRQGPAARPQRPRPEAGPGHLLPGPLERAAHRRRELPVPVVPGPQRRADQQDPVHEKGGLDVADFPKTIGRAAGDVQDAQGQDRRPCAHSA